MRVRTLLIALLVAGTTGARLAWPASASESRARAFVNLPDWTGMWETDAARQLLKTGEFAATALQARPPYNDEWENKAPRPLPPVPGRDPLPSTTKICAPAGFPTAMGQPVPDTALEFLITPEQTLIVSSDRTVRHIYTDGRPHPSGPDLWPTLEGHSIGRWKDNTLFIDTIARTAGPVTNIPGSAVLSDKAHFTERLRLLDRDTMLNDMTIQDPDRLSRVWTIQIRYQRIKDMDRMVAVDCFENDRNPVVDGKIVIAAP